MMDNVETVGQRIKVLLKQKGMPQKALAKAVGVTETSLSRYINGIRIPKYTTLNKIASVLGIKPDYFFYGQEIKEDEAAAYFKVSKLIALHAGRWKPEQKAALVTILFQKGGEG